MIKIPWERCCNELVSKVRLGKKGEKQMRKSIWVFIIILVSFPGLAQIDQYRPSLTDALWNLQKVDPLYINEKLTVAEELLKSSDLSLRREGEAILESLKPLFVDVRAVETRAIWVDYVTFGKFMETGDICRLLDQLKEIGIHILFPEVYAYGTTIYPSKVAKLQDQYRYLWEDGDILKIFIAEAHKRDMEVHPLVRIFSAGYKEPGHLIKEHPEWLEVTKDGTRGSSRSYFISPTIPEFRRYLEAVMTELVTNYEIDGLHLDYIRYEDGDFGYSAPSRELYKKLFFVDPLLIKKNTLEEASFKEFRRAHVDAFVRFCHESLKKIRPNLLISAAVGSPYSWANKDLFQDWVYWAKYGYIDFVTPMEYRDTTPKFSIAVQEDIKANVANIPLFSGLGLYLFAADELENQIVEVQKNNLPGIALFSEANMGIIKFLKLKNGVFREPAYPVHRKPGEAIEIYLNDLITRIRENSTYLQLEKNTVESWLKTIEDFKGVKPVENSNYPRMAKAINERLGYLQMLRKYYRLPIDNFAVAE